MAEVTGRCTPVLVIKEDETREISFAESSPTSEPAGQFAVDIGRKGTLLLEVTSTRPLRLFLRSSCVLDQTLFWRLFNRRFYAAVIVPAEPGEMLLHYQAGTRPRHPA